MYVNYYFIQEYVKTRFSILVVNHTAKYFLFIVLKIITTPLCFDQLKDRDSPEIIIIIIVNNKLYLNLLVTINNKVLEALELEII